MTSRVPPTYTVPSSIRTKRGGADDGTSPGRAGTSTSSTTTASGISAAAVRASAPARTSARADGAAAPHERNGRARGRVRLGGHDPIAAGLLGLVEVLVRGLDQRLVRLRVPGERRHPGADREASAGLAGAARERSFPRPSAARVSPKASASWRVAP